MFNIVNMIRSAFESDENDLFVLDCIPGNVKGLLNIARKSELFRGIYLIKAGSISGTTDSYVKAFISIAFPQIIHLPYKSCDQVFITGTEIYSRLIACQFIKKNPKCKMFYYEDGMASYTNILSSGTSNNRTNRMLKQRFGFCLYKKCSGMYVYRPEYVIHNDWMIPLEKILNIEAGSNLANKFWKLFSEDTEKLENVDATNIYFDANFNKRQDIDDTFVIINELIRLLGNDFVVKPHPSKIDQWKDFGVSIFTTNDSFEIYCLNHSLKNKVLISAFSTACILPKLIFDEEPKVILLYNLYHNYPNSWNEGDAIYHKIKDNYVNKEHFWIPNDMEELNSKIEGFIKD